MRSNFLRTAALLTLSAGLAAASGTANAQQRTTALRIGQYNKATEVVATGTIQSIQTQSGAASLPRGTYLTLQSTPVALSVHMGMFSTAAIPFKAGDHVTVTGSLMTVNGAQVLLARLVQSSSQNLTVRNENGFALRPALPHSSAQSSAQIAGGLQ